MWKIKKGIYLETIDRLKKVQCDLANLENAYGSRIMNSITIDDPKFKDPYYDIDLIELDNNLYRLEQILEQYVKEEDEYYESIKTEES